MPEQLTEEEVDQLNMMIFMCALQKLLIEHGAIDIPHKYFDSFLSDEVNALCVEPIKGGVRVFNQKSKEAA